MRTLPGSKPLALNGLYTPGAVFNDGPEYGFSSHYREVSLWSAVFLLNGLIGMLSLVAGIFFAATHSGPDAILSLVVGAATIGISVFMLSRPPWRITLNATTRTYRIVTGFRPFVRERDGALTEVRGIGAATVKRRGEEACVLYLKFNGIPRPYFLAWHPIASKEIVVREAKKLTQRLGVLFLTGKEDAKA